LHEGVLLLLAVGQHKVLAQQVLSSHLKCLDVGALWFERHKKIQAPSATIVLGKTNFALFFTPFFFCLDEGNV
jgi:hypothetical protein